MIFRIFTVCIWLVVVVLFFYRNKEETPKNIQPVKKTKPTKPGLPGETLYRYLTCADRTVYLN